MNTEIIPAGQPYEGAPLAPMQVNTAAAISRAQHEVQAEYLMAMRMPRDEISAAAAPMRRQAR